MNNFYKLKMLWSYLLRFSTSNNLIGMPRHGTQNISSHISQYKHLVLSLVLQQPQCDFTLDTASMYGRYYVPPSLLVLLTCTQTVQ